MRAGLMKTGKPKRRAAADASRGVRTTAHGTWGRPADWATRLVASLSIPAAEPRTPQPT